MSKKLSGISLRCDEETKDSIYSAAKDAGMKPSAYIRHLHRSHKSAVKAQLPELDIHHVDEFGEDSLREDNKALLR